MAAKGGARTKRSAFDPKSTVAVDFGPWLGVNDTLDPKGADWTEYLNAAVNAFVPPGLTGLQNRPGFATRLSARNGRCRAMHYHTKSDGTGFPLGFFENGASMQVYRLDTGADITPTGFAWVTGSTAPIFCISYNDNIVFHDGTIAKAPYYWPGTASAATAILIGNGGTTSAAYGRPWVYGDRLFFIRLESNVSWPAVRNTITWSDVNSVATGYTQAGFTNKWTFTQTSTEGLCGGIGTNDEMYIFRANSIARVTGTTNASFQTNATFDGVADHIGCPLGLAVRVEAAVYFLDQLGRPGIIEPGGRYRPLYAPCQTTGAGFRGDGTLNGDAFPPAFMVYWAPTDMLLWTQTSASSHPLYLCAMSRSTERYQGLWIDGDTQAFLRGQYTTSTSVGFDCFGTGLYSGEWVLFRAKNDFSVDYARFSPTDQNTAFVGSTTDYEVTCQFTTGPLFYDEQEEKVFSRVLLTCQYPSNQILGRMFWLQWQTSRGASASINTGLTISKTATWPEVAKLLTAVDCRGRYMKLNLDTGRLAQNGSAHTAQGFIRFLGLRIPAKVSGLGDNDVPGSFMPY